MQHSRLLFLALSSGLLWGCKNDAPLPKSTPGQAVTDQTKPTRDTLQMPDVSVNGAVPYDIIEGTLFWSGSQKSDQMYSAKIPVSGGEVLVNNQFIVQGKMLFDLKGLVVEGGQGDTERQRLQSVLQGADFFNVARYPTMEYVIEGALPSSIPAFNTVLEGSFKIRNQTNVVNIPMMFSCNGNRCQMESTTFDLGYGGWGLRMPGDKPKDAKSNKQSAAAPPVADMVRLVLKCTLQKR